MVLMLASTEAVGLQDNTQLLKLPDYLVKADVQLLRSGSHEMIEERFAPSAVSVGNQIYIFGGCGYDGRVHSSIERFDTKTGESHIIGKMKRPRMWHQAVLAGNKIYIIGGDRRFWGDRGVDDTMEIYDLDTGVSEYGPTMPDGRSTFAAVVYDEMIYVLGGTRRRGGAALQTNRVIVFDIAAKKWKEGVPMPTPKSPKAVLVQGGFIVVVGGYGGMGNRSSRAVESYDPRANAWMTLPGLSKGRSAHAIANIGRKIYIFGDYAKAHEVMVYDLITKTSDVVSVDFEPARDAAIATVGDTLYVIGGKIDAERGALSSIQAFMVPAAKN